MLFVYHVSYKNEVTLTYFEAKNNKNLLFPKVMRF